MVLQLAFCHRASAANGIFVVAHHCFDRLIFCQCRDVLVKARFRCASVAGPGCYWWAAARADRFCNCESGKPLPGWDVQAGRPWHEVTAPHP